MPSQDAGHWLWAGQLAVWNTALGQLAGTWLQRVQAFLKLCRHSGAWTGCVSRLRLPLGPANNKTQYSAGAGTAQGGAVHKLLKFDVDDTKVGSYSAVGPGAGVQCSWPRSRKRPRSNQRPLRFFYLGKNIAEPFLLPGKPSRHTRRQNMPAQDRDIVIVTRARSSNLAHSQMWVKDWALYCFFLEACIASVTSTVFTMADVTTKHVLLKVGGLARGEWDEKWSWGSRKIA